MKFLLTSSGISNDSIRNALVDLLGKPIAESSALCIPTAMHGMPGGAAHACRFIRGSGLTTPMCDLGWQSLGVLELTALPANPEAEAVAELERIRTNTGKEKAARLREEMQTIMMDNVSVFRDEPLMRVALDKVRELKRRFLQVQIDDKGKRFNTDLLETFELGCLLDLAEVTTVSALNRTESRGGHSREDFPKRDDVNWLKHTFTSAGQPSGAALTQGEMKVDYRPVVITKFQPKERTY